MSKGAALTAGRALDEDRPRAPDLEAVAALIGSGAIEEAAGLGVK